MMKKNNLFLLTICCVILCCVGCNKQTDEKQWHASCHIYVENLPEEYSNLPVEIKENTIFSLTLSNASAEKRYTIQLSEKNDYQQVISLLPGSYSVSEVYVSNQLLAPFSASLQTQTLTIEPNTVSSLPVSISNPAIMIGQIRKNVASETILKEAVYARKVQFAGTVYDMNQLAKEMNFISQEEKNIASGETAYLSARNQSGIYMIVQNTSDNNLLSINQCECIGFRFTNINAILPKGITIGLPVEKIAHAKTGMLGTPAYCLGTPLIGMGMDTSTLIYLDAVSGDRISIELDSFKGYIRSITYEFQRYQ